MQNLLSQVFYTVKNVSCTSETDLFIAYKQMSYYASQVFSTEFANSFYNCYLFGNSIYKVADSRLSKFSDFTDFYTSFLFNLLSQSLSIRNIATKIQTDYTNAKYPDLAGQVAQIIRIIIDFDSSNAASLKAEAPSKSNFANLGQSVSPIEKTLQSAFSEDVKTLQ